MNGDAASRLDDLEIRLGFKAEPPPPDQWDQQHSNYLLGLEEELKQARADKNKVQVDATTAAMTEFLDTLSPERRKAVQKIMARDRLTRARRRRSRSSTRVPTAWIAGALRPAIMPMAERRRSAPPRASPPTRRPRSVDAHD